MPERPFHVEMSDQEMPDKTVHQASQPRLRSKFPTESGALSPGSGCQPTPTVELSKEILAFVLDVAKINNTLVYEARESKSLLIICCFLFRWCCKCQFQITG